MSAVLWLAHVAQAALAVIVYTVGLYVYRIYFSPLSKFPGPKSAAASLLYEGYYDLIKDGQYPWRIREMHQQYGMSMLQLESFFICYFDLSIAQDSAAD